MANFESFLKYLGKEDAFSPDDIKKGIEKQEKMDSLNNFTDISDESIANVERLISGSAFQDDKPAAPSSTPETPAPISLQDIDPEVLKEFEKLDGPAPNIHDLESRLTVMNYDDLDKEMETSAETEEMPTESEETPSSDEEVDLLTPQFRTSEPEPEEPEFITPEETPPALPEESFSLPDFGTTEAVEPAVQDFTFPESVEMPASGEPDQFPDFTLPDLETTAVSEPEAPLAAAADELPGGFELPDFNLEEPIAEKEAAPGGLDDLQGFFNEQQAAETSLPLESVETESPDISIPEFDMSSFETPTELPEKEPVEAAETVPAAFEMPDFEMPEELPEKFRQSMEEQGGEKESVAFSELKRPETRREEKPGQSMFPSGIVRLELDADKVAKIRSRINRILNPTLRKKVRMAILEGAMEPDEQQELLTMLLLNEEENAIRNYVDSRVKDEIVERKVQEKAEAVEAAKPPKPKRKVIYAEEMHKAAEFQKEFQNVSKNALLIFGGLILLGFVFWRLIFIPILSSRYYQQGYNALKRTDYEIAEIKFKAGKNISGPDMHWYNVFATGYMEKKEWEFAKRKFIEALEHNPMDKETLFNFADYYKSIYPPRFEEAIALYTRLLKKSPENFEYVDKVGTTYIEWADRTLNPADKVERYAVADKIFEAFLAKKSKHTGSYYRLLDIALRIKKADRIDILYDTIDHINKSAVNIKTLTDLSRYYLDEHRIDRAKLVLNKLMGSIPFIPKTKVQDALNASEAYYEYSRFLTINMDFLKALKTVSNAIVLNPKSGKAYNLMGEIYFISDNIPNNKVLAKSEFENAIKHAPNYYKPYANIGHLYYNFSLNFNDPERALSEALYNYKIANTLLDPTKKDPLLSYNLGWLYYKNTDYDDALNEFAKIYIDEPYNPVLSYNMGNTFYHLNKYDLAISQYDKSIQYYEGISKRIGYVNPDITRHKDVFTSLARAYNNRGVIYALYAKQYKKQSRDYEQKALLDFYKAKDSANRISTIYNFAEFNIKHILNKAMRNIKPAFDDDMAKRTTLQKLIDEFRDKLIKTI